MIYYDQPTKLAPAVEDLIANAIRQQIPPAFKAAKNPDEFPPPKLPADSLACIKLKPGFKAELVAAEPQIASPVAIDWGLTAGSGSWKCTIIQRASTASSSPAAG